MNRSRPLYVLRPALRLLCLAAVICLPACGDPAAGTIKAPSREEMQPGGGGTSAAPAAKSPRAKAADAVKTIGPGAKKLP